MIQRRTKQLPTPFRQQHGITITVSLNPIKNELVPVGALRARARARARARVCVCVHCTSLCQQQILLYFNGSSQHNFIRSGVGAAGKTEGGSATDCH